MNDPKGFMKHEPEEFEKEPSKERIKHWNEFIKIPSEEVLSVQASRCMDCGVPFCQSGCPIGNIIPDWNDLVYNGRWMEAIERLHKTNNFPEFTGRICPAPCENACVLSINKPAVTIKNIELAIIEHAYDQGWIKPMPPSHRTGKRVAVVGSGPAGLACADQLNQQGHDVTVYEKNEVIGGILTLGIPNFKLEKWVVKRRVNRMREEGVKFKTQIHVGVDIDPNQLKAEYNAIVLCGGSEEYRDLRIPGRELEGIYPAMTFLSHQGRRGLGISIDPCDHISAEGKKVIVLGGGDTGSDCVGTCNRQGALSLKQFELLARPSDKRSPDNPWPNWAFIYRTSSSHEEGVERDFCIMTKSLSGENGKLKKIHAVRLEFGPKDPETGMSPMKEIPGSDFEVECDLLLLALGFTGPIKKGMLEQLGVEFDSKGNVKADENKMTNIPGVFTAGDMTRGQSLVVWAINEGRTAAKGVHRYLIHF